MGVTRRPAARKSIAHLPTPDEDLGISNKENAGADGLTTATMAAQKKTRSKSMGPGGLDALREDAGNRRKVIAALPKSILKPSIPLSPLREIPTRKQTMETGSAQPPSSPSPNTATPTKATNQVTKQITPARSPASPLKNMRKETIVEDKSQDVPEEDDASKQQRQQQREQIQKQREARRKSMANRRVSFAPEATLHTFDNLEDLQDSTTSSASTNSTRRASQMSKGSPFRPSTTVDSPSNSSEQGGEDGDEEQSPSMLTELQRRKRRRRSSGIPPLNFNNPDDALSSSPYSEATATIDENTFVDAEEQVDGDVESSPSGSTSMVGSSPVSTEVKSPTATRLRDAEGDMDIQASMEQDAGDEEDDGGMTMEMAGDEVTSAFQPWIQKRSNINNTSQFDQENINPFSQASRANAPLPQGFMADSDEMSMDMTRAVGGILAHKSPSKSGQNSPTRRSITASRRRSSGASSSFEDGTMDFTTAIGGIQPSRDADGETSLIDQNEDLSMEFTSVFGGIRNDQKRQSVGFNRSDEEKRLSTVAEERTGDFLDEEGDMEMTTALGEIRSTVHRGDAAQIGDGEVDMDITRAVGGMLPKEQRLSTADMQLVTETVAAQSPLRNGVTPRPRPAISTSASGSPSLTGSRGRGRPRKSEPQAAQVTPIKVPTTPPAQLTPQPSRPRTPEKTPPANIAMRHPSPKRLFSAEIKQAKSSPLVKSPGLFMQDLQNGGTTPKVRLAPTSQGKRRASGIGFDKEGLGSPRIAALLDRRVSIGDQAEIFAPSISGGRGVRFQDPRSLEAEIAKEREEDERRESGQVILQNEANGENSGRDATITLRDAIVGMTPKKEKLKGRKSLAVGTAKGLLGKRPAELDEEDDEATPNKFRGRETSPLKRIRLQAPPSASEMTRRNPDFSRSVGPTMGVDRPTTPIAASPPRKSASTPGHKGHFKDVESLLSAQKPIPVMGQSDPSRDPEQPEEAENAENIGLQDFLNLTSIRFMELNTTKRRHTVAPGPRSDQDDDADDKERDETKSFGDAVVAGACTIPLLELYQHSCRELKKYISDGRKVVREIEVNTLEDNPSLFQEYISATPSERAVMDNQFKDMKTHARHVSKGMWYEWRMKLVGGLRGVLVAEAESLKADSILFEEQERMLEDGLPSLIREHEHLEQEVGELRQRADEIANCDQGELANVRKEVRSRDISIQAKRQRLAEMQSRAEELDKSLEDGQDAKVECQRAIQDAQRVREECRGWSAGDVNRLKEQVEALEAEYDWVITSAVGTRLTMIYHGELELFFDTVAFLPAANSRSSNSPLGLSYIADSRERKPLPLTTEKRFFLQIMRAHLHGLVQHEMQVADILTFVSASWTQALALSEEVSHLDLEGITHCSILNDERLVVKTMMFLPSVETKVDINFEIGATAKDMDISMRLKTRAEVAYGEQYREDKMRDFIKARIGEGMGMSTNISTGSWADAVKQLKERLIARGRKQ